MSISLEHQAPSDVRRLKKAEKNMPKEAVYRIELVELNLTEFSKICKLAGSAKFFFSAYIYKTNMSGSCYFCTKSAIA